MSGAGPGAARAFAGETAARERSPALVVQAVNSFVGKVGNIGYRTGFVLDRLDRDGVAAALLARGTARAFRARTRTMGPLGQVPRILNAFRIYVKHDFDARSVDIRLFEAFGRMALAGIDRGATVGTKILHCWELAPRLMARAKAMGYRIVLDVPIAPSLQALENHEKGYNPVPHLDFGAERRLEQACFDLADRIIVPSAFVRDVVSRYGVEDARMRVIPFGINPRPGSGEPGPRAGGEGLRFVFAGNITGRKGVDYLLEAFDHPDFAGDTLHLCGRLYPEQARRLEARGLRNVVLPGFVDTAEYFRAGDVYVFPSLLEGSSKSVYEAMDAGMPIITTPNSGSVCRHGIDGFIVPPASARDIREAMLRFKADPALVREMGGNAARHVRGFTWERYAGRVAEVYAEP
jgi:glycosyltransferase involved in cell wall biosynthesis